jgi:hypothetical protein
MGDSFLGRMLNNTPNTEGWKNQESLPRFEDLPQKEQDAIFNFMGPLEAPLPIMALFTKPEILEKVIGPMMKYWENPAPKAIRSFKNFLGKYPEEAADAIKYIHHTPSMYPSADTAGAFFHDPIPKSMLGEIKMSVPDLPKEALTGKGYLVKIAPEKGAVDYIDTNIHEMLHNLHGPIKDPYYNDAMETAISNAAPVLTEGKSSWVFDELIRQFLEKNKK